MQMSQDPDASNAKPPDADLFEDASDQALAKEEASGVSDDGAKSDTPIPFPLRPIVAPQSIGSLMRAPAIHFWSSCS